MNLTNQQSADCSVLSCSLRTDTLLHVPVQPVIVLHTLSSKCHIHLSPQTFVKAESAKQGNADVISPALPPPFSPTVSTACTKYSCLYFRIPRQRIPQPHSGTEFCLNCISRYKAPSPLIPFNHQLCSLLIIKAKFLGIVQSERKSYPSSCFTTHYP